ncbi:hypothetical protein [Streptomyces sp. NPDC052179]|uniref:hypothetical protein n=1 Tax=Streptomyces sp. NPDC052179 TaxID=3155680 RepID=UPI003429986B
MSIILDPALLKGMESTVGHAGPFTVEECENIKDLHIRNSRNLIGLDQCSTLEVLTLVACDPVDMGQAAALKKLRSLTVRDSGLESLKDIAKLPLLSCYTPRNLISDITPLIRAARLRNLDLTGNPLSEISYRQLIPDLLGRGCRVIYSDELEWKLTHHLHDEGVSISCYRSDKGYRLCRPGLRLTGSPEYGHPVIRERDVHSLLKGDPERAHAYFGDEKLVPFA